MKEIISKIPIVLNAKETVEQIIDWIPLFAAIAGIAALKDIPGTIGLLCDIAKKIERFIKHR